MYICIFFWILGGSRYVAFKLRTSFKEISPGTRNPLPAGLQVRCVYHSDVTGELNEDHVTWICLVGDYEIIRV